MKKSILLVALAVAFSIAPAFAYDERNNDRDYRRDDRHRADADRSDRSDWRINHLSRMVTHVRWQARHYRANWRLRREVDQIAGEVDHVEWLYRRYGENWRVRRDVDRLRDRLHQIEVQLRVRSRDFYRWE